MGYQAGACWRSGIGGAEARDYIRAPAGAVRVGCACRTNHSCHVIRVCIHEACVASARAEAELPALRLAVAGTARGRRHVVRAYVVGGTQGAVSVQRVVAQPADAVLASDTHAAYGYGGEGRTRVGGAARAELGAVAGDARASRQFRAAVGRREARQAGAVNPGLGLGVGGGVCWALGGVLHFGRAIRALRAGRAGHDGGVPLLL